MCILFFSFCFIYVPLCALLQSNYCLHLVIITLVMIVSYLGASYLVVMYLFDTCWWVISFFLFCLCSFLCIVTIQILARFLDYNMCDNCGGWLVLCIWLLVVILPEVY